MSRVVLIAICVSFLVSFVPSQGQSQAIVLKGVTHLPKNNDTNDPVELFVEKVNKAAKGRLRIDWLGGPEVIAPFDQIMALKGGSIDMILYYPFAYMASIMPESYCKGISELAEWEERKTGAFALWTDIFAKRANAKYLGRFQSISHFVIYSKKKVSKLGDFQGMKIRVMPLYAPFIKALGAAPITLPLTDTYTALERGVADGLMFPRFGMVNQGFHEVTKYIIEPGVFQMEPATMINLDKWKKIPQDLQETIMEVMEDMEYIGTIRNFQVEAYEDGVRAAKGMEIIQLPPADAVKYRQLAYEKTWEFVLSKATEYGPKMKQLTSKKALPKGSFPWVR